MDVNVAYGIQSEEGRRRLLEVFRLVGIILIVEIDVLLRARLSG